MVFFLLGLLNLQHVIELEHPAEEDVADLDGDLCAEGGLVDALDLGILAEFVIDAAEERLIEAQGHPGGGAAVHLERGLHVAVDVGAHLESGLAGVSFLDFNRVHTVDAVGGLCSVLGAVREEVVIVLVHHHGNGIDDVAGLVLAELLLAVFVEIVIEKRNLLLFQKSGFDVENGIIDLFVCVLARVERDEIAGQKLRAVIAAESGELFDELVGLLIRYEGRRLYGVDQYLELRRAESALRDVVRLVMPDESAHDLIPALVEHIDIHGDRPAVAAYAHLLKPFDDLVRRQRMRFVGFPAQHLPQLQKLDL